MYETVDKRLTFRVVSFTGGLRWISSVDGVSGFSWSWDSSWTDIIVWGFVLSRWLTAVKLFFVGTVGSFVLACIISVGGIKIM